MKILCSILLMMTVSSRSAAPVSIVTDGILNEPEWKNAKNYPLGSGNNLRLLQEKEFLYIAFSGKEKYWTQLYLSNGDTARILHASAALGAVNYKKQDNKWTTRDTYSYELRESIYNAETEKKMSDYFLQHGWVANNNNMAGGHIIEFRISLREAGQPLWLAAVMATNDKVYTFPASLSDHSVLPTIVQGNTVDSIQLIPKDWLNIR